MVGDFSFTDNRIVKEKGGSVESQVSRKDSINSRCTVLSETVAKYDSAGIFLKGIDHRVDLEW